MEANHDTPILLNASAYVDQMRAVQDATEAEVERVKQVFHEIERRDGAANWHAALWFRFACLLAVVLIVAISAVVYFAMMASKVQVFIQTVERTHEGQIVVVGIPEDLLKYEPEDGAYMDLIAQWVTKRRWKGDESGMKRTRNDWAWLYRHSCGFASKALANDELKEMPFKPGPKRASIEVKSITKTSTPTSYQILWHEVSVDMLASTLKEVDFVGTFTVGRLRPKTLSDAIDNRLGICVTGYDLAPRVGS